MFRSMVIGLGSMCLIALAVLGFQNTDRIKLPDWNFTEISFFEKAAPDPVIELATKKEMEYLWELVITEATKISEQLNKISSDEKTFSARMGKFEKSNNKSISELGLLVSALRKDNQLLAQKLSNLEKTQKIKPTISVTDIKPMLRRLELLEDKVEVLRKNLAVPPPSKISPFEQRIILLEGDNLQLNLKLQELKSKQNRDNAVGIVLESDDSLIQLGLGKSLVKKIEKLRNRLDRVVAAMDVQKIESMSSRVSGAPHNFDYNIRSVVGRCGKIGAFGICSSEYLDWNTSFSYLYSAESLDSSMGNWLGKHSDSSHALLVAESIDGQAHWITGFKIRTYSSGVYRGMYQRPKTIRVYVNGKHAMYFKLMNVRRDQEVKLQSSQGFVKNFSIEIIDTYPPTKGAKDLADLGISDSVESIEARKNYVGIVSIELLTAKE